MISFQIQWWHAFIFIGALVVGLSFIMRWYLISLKLGKEIRGTADHRKVTLSDTPVEVNANVRTPQKRFNHQVAEERHEEVTGRLDGHDAEIDEIWKTMRAEDQDTRKQIQAASERNAERFTQIAGSLGRIEGQLKISQPPES